MTRVDLSIVDGVLQVAGRAVSFELPVAEAVQGGENIVVRFEVPHGVIRNDNVACCDPSGTPRWVIEPGPHGGTNDNPYVSLRLRDDAIMVQNWNGVEYLVNADNGAVSAVGLNRFS